MLKELFLAELIYVWIYLFKSDLNNKFQNKNHSESILETKTTNSSF